MNLFKSKENKPKLTQEQMNHNKMIELGYELYPFAALHFAHLNDKLYVSREDSETIKQKMSNDESTIDVQTWRSSYLNLSGISYPRPDETERIMQQEEGITTINLNRIQYIKAFYYFFSKKTDDGNKS